MGLQLRVSNGLEELSTTAGYDPLPARLAPMAASTADRLPEDDSKWAFEVKWDGVRALAFVDGGSIRLQNRNGVDITGRYPEVSGLRAGAREGLPWSGRQLLVDGEVVALDAEGRPSFNLLARHLAPVSYVVFDLCHLDGRSLLTLPYIERRALLDSLDLTGPGPPVSTWRVPAYHLGDGAQLFEATLARGLEGLVAKRLDSAYQPGKRSRAWLKLKHRHRQELVVGGWTPGEGKRSGTLGALLVGYHDGDELRFAGRVGTGFSERDLVVLSAVLRHSSRADQPFGPSTASLVPHSLARLARWAEPVLVVEVSFAEWTPDARLRHPAYLGTRDDVDPAAVIREPASTILAEDLKRGGGRPAP